MIQYGKVKKYRENGITNVNKYDLINYYQNYNEVREINWKKRLGEDLNWALSFDYLKEKDTTKHVHRLHPYKGKFIPQLVEYFLDENIDFFKKERYFQKGDIVIDPFAGSGTTLVQANELGIHAIGIDLSAFNTLISNVKLIKIDFQNLEDEIKTLTYKLKTFIEKTNHLEFKKELLEELNAFNQKFFPSPDYKIKVRNKEIDEKIYAPTKEKQFKEIFNSLKSKYNLKTKQDNPKNFIEKWYLIPIKREIDFAFEILKRIKNQDTKKIMTVILSRTIRSCRATTHADLATLKEPITKTYYCRKHGKICKPLFSIFSWWQRYSKDTVNRLKQFEDLKTNTLQICLQGDAKNIDIMSALKSKKLQLAKLLKEQKIKGIFSSPPYLGLINYHRQHEYAYDLFEFKRKDELEIGPLFRGKGKEARNSYIEGITAVLNNTKKYLQRDYDIFLVANDKYNMYPTIADKANMQIIDRYKRPVLNRTEKDKGAYSEIIFHLKRK